MFSCLIGPIYRIFVPGETRGAAKASSSRLTASSKVRDCVNSSSRRQEIAIAIWATRKPPLQKVHPGACGPSQREAVSRGHLAAPV
jgi:hypothetical protein